MQIQSKSIGDIISQNGMEYAKSVIIDRALPNIDGFKPSQRKVLYTMYKLGLTKGKKAKCSKIAGQTLTYYPHGEGTAYTTMIGMTDKKEAYNVPYVCGKGSFGKVYSRDLQHSHMRYPEAGLAPISEEIFEGLNDGATRMVPNFDDTETEPELLPVKFPTLLVNPIIGIAVGKSCNIPAFPLINVCMATAGVAAGSINTAEDLVDVIGFPEYTTGGVLHCNRKMMVDLCKNGTGTFVISGVADTYSDRIEINEIPFTTTAEQITDEITTLVREDKLKEVSRVHNAIDLKGMQIKVFIKRGYDSGEVLKKLYRMTSLRDTISYRIKIIYNNECKDDIGVLDVIKMWLEFRHQCIINQYSTRIKKQKEKCHKLETWRIISSRIQEVGAEIPKGSQSHTEQWLKEEFGLDSVQVDYLLSMQARAITTDNMIKNIKQLDDMLNEIKETQKVIDDPNVRNRLIIEQLQQISKKYGKEPMSQHADVINEKKEEERQIKDNDIVIKYTKNGYVKRLITTNDIINFQCPVGDRVLRTISMKNNEYLLVFTYDGEMYKILADDIDSSKGGIKQSVVDLLKLESADKVLWVDHSGDYSGYFNLVYPNGKGERVHYSKASGSRMKYISMYKPAEVGQAWVTQSNKFFAITARRQASFVDITGMGFFTSARVFKAAGLRNNDRIVGLQPLDKVPNLDSINVERYNRPYTVAIGNDILWDDTEQKKIQAEKEKQLQEQIAMEKKKEEQKKMKELDKIFAAMGSVDDDEEF